MKSKFTIILFLISLSVLFSRDHLRIVSSDQSSIIIEYKLDEVDFGKISSFGQIEYGYIIPHGSDDKLPSINFNLAVPSEFGNTIEVLSTAHQFQEVKNDFARSVVEADYKSELIQFSNFGISRDLQIQTITINPLLLDRNRNTLKVYSKILFKVNYAKTTKADFIELKNNQVPRTVLNFESAKNWGLKSNTLSKINSSSVLATGTWYRFEAPEEGIYSIKRSQLSDLGIDASSVDPRTIKIYNQGGKRLSWTVEHSDPTDLTEIAISVTGEDDGVFNENDQIIFYGRGTDFWEFDRDTDNYERFHHPYSKKNYFWITSGGETGKRIQVVDSPTSNNIYNQTNSVSFVSLDEDKINIGKSGLDYWGDNLQPGNNLTYINTLYGLVPGTEVNYKFRMANTSLDNAAVSFSQNDNQFLSGSLPGFISYSATDNRREYSWGVDRIFSGSHSLNFENDRSVLKILLTSSSSSVLAYLDYYEIQYLKSLQAYEDEIKLFSELQNSVIQFRVFNFSNSSIHVYDISDYSSCNENFSYSIEWG
jgi:hypothetical protein